MFFAGCALSYTVKEPVPSSLDYGRKDIKPISLTIVDKRTGADSIFLAKVLGVGGSMSDSISVTIDSMADPIAYFSQQMERELNSRGIPVKCVVGKSATEGLVLLINKYQIVNVRATGFSPWEACHTFYGTIVMDKLEKPIKAYFYNGKTPVWSMKEVEEPCFTIPVSIIIKDVASKINRAVFNLRASNEKVDALTAQIDTEIGKDKDPYDRPFWKVLELGYTNNPKATEPLKKYTQDSDEFFKSCALSSIGTLGADDQLEFLIQQYRAAAGYNDKYMAAKSIGDIGTPAALQVLQDMKKDKAYTSEGGLKYCVDLYAP